MIEIYINHQGYSFTVIYGPYINGYFISLPYWQVACDASYPDNVSYNQSKLEHAFSKLNNSFSSGYLDELAKVIAMSIRDGANED